VGFAVLKDLSVLQVDGISIQGQLLLPDLVKKYPLVCLCHGVPSGDASQPNDGGYPALAERFCREGLAVYFFNFRGTGDSGGNLDLMGWTRDLQAVLDYLNSLDNIDKSHLSLVGFSAGAAVSIYIASKDKRVSGVAACACPAEIIPLNHENSWQSFIDHLRKIGVIRDDGFPPSVDEWVEGCQQINPVKHIAGIAPRPVFIVHGRRDDTVPVSHAERLYEAAGFPKKLVIIEGAGHRLRQDERVINPVLDWLKSNLTNPG
jgi:dipeptidyl aminopeptidase/acylaminoacyl peptidase